MEHRRVEVPSDVEADVAELAAGRTTLVDFEIRMLGTLQLWCRRAVVLQCSHGQDALALWKLGVPDVIGIDFSARMLELARRKSQLLGVPATWIEADVLEAPRELDGSADLVYTGKGALPWIFALDRWAEVIARLLRPGGRFLLTEGHPLDWVWQTGLTGPRVGDDQEADAEMGSHHLLYFRDLFLRTDCPGVSGDAFVSPGPGGGPTQCMS